MTQTTHALIRVWMPDRPGALGLVASRIGSVRGDIVGVGVLEQGDGVVVDEFAVDLADEALLPVMIREIEEVDGASVEQVRIVAHFPDPRLDALDTAAGLCEAADLAELHEQLVTMLHAEFLAGWVALTRAGAPLAATGEPPPPAVLEALVTGTAASAAVANGETGPEDLAVATLTTHGATLLVGRDGQPFRRLERAQLLALARIADRAWTLLAGAPVP